MSAKTNMEIVRRLFEEVYTGGDSSLIESLVASNVKLHDPAAKNFKQGIEGFKLREEMYTNAFPSKKATIDQIFAAEDTVSVRWTVTGTHDRDLPGIPATGKNVTVTGTSIFRLKDDKVTEIWQNWDELGMLSQIGIGQASAYAGQR